jgi:hypothetical protein
MARNTIAGTSRGKSRSAKYYQENPEARAKKKSYDSEFQKAPKQVKKRTELNKVNRDKGTYGNKDFKDFDHAVNKMVDQKTNRGRNSKNKKSTPGDRRARG